MKSHFNFLSLHSEAEWNSNKLEEEGVKNVAKEEVGFDV